MPYSARHQKPLLGWYSAPWTQQKPARKEGLLRLRQESFLTVGLLPAV
jgi:hypothetical protein